MDDTSSGGPMRLRGAGIGSIGGGLTLGTLSILLPYAPAAAATLGIGIVVWLFYRGADRGDGIGLGCAAIGAIGLFEAFGLGLGFGPAILAVLAVAAGLVDVFVGGTLDRFRGER